MSSHSLLVDKCSFAAHQASANERILRSHAGGYKIAKYPICCRSEDI